VAHLGFTIPVTAWLPCRRMDSLAQLVGPQAHLLAESLRQIVRLGAWDQLQGETASYLPGTRLQPTGSQLQGKTAFRIRGLRQQQTVSRS